MFAALTDSSDYEEGAEREVAAYLAKSRTPGSYTKLLVGDSVCAQMTEAFYDCNQQYCLVGNNRALTMAGEYLLVKEFLETHENVSEVWLMASDVDRCHIQLFLCGSSVFAGGSAGRT